MASFGKFIKNERERRGWNQTELGARIKVNMPLVCRIENDKKHLAVEKLQLLAEAFEMDYNAIKDKYFADKFAKEAIKYQCSDKIFQIAEGEAKYLKSNNAQQGQIQF